MKKLLLPLTVLFMFGCANISPNLGTSLPHESSESKLMTEEEFRDRAKQSAALVYEGMREVHDAARQYALDNNGSLPVGSSRVVEPLLLQGGYLKTWPVIPPFAFTDPVQKDLRYISKYDNMDGIGPLEDLISAPDLKIEVCEEFILHYSSFGPGDTIYDYEANRSQFPGQRIGRHIKIYAINWSRVNSQGSDADPAAYCEVQWVMQYNK
jgi:hypothetical protein